MRGLNPQGCRVTSFKVPRRVADRADMIAPPIEPMLAKLADVLPGGGSGGGGGDYLYEPKWDGFRAIVFRSASDVFIQSRDLKPLDRYFPDLHEALLERLLAGVGPPLYLTPMTEDRRTAAKWLERFEGAGLDGVIAKPADAPYQPGKRAMIKVKHARTADCAVGGFRWHKTGTDAVGSLLLGLYDGRGALQHVGVTSSFTMAMRQQLVRELAPLRKNALASHPWRSWAQAETGSARMPGAQSRWSAGKDLSWEPLRVERVCEVKYDHLQGDRFRHAATFLRWRPDKEPRDCRYDQLEVTPAYELSKVFSSGSRRS